MSKSNAQLSAEVRSLNLPACFKDDKHFYRIANRRVAIAVISSGQKDGGFYGITDVMPETVLHFEGIKAISEKEFNEAYMSARQLADSAAGIETITLHTTPEMIAEHEAEHSYCV